MTDQRIVQRALTYEQDATLDGNQVTLRRMVNTREGRAFEWLVDPVKAALWSPCVPTARVSGTGPVQLRRDLDGATAECQVLEYKAPHRLAYDWEGQEVLFTIAGTGIVPAASPSCLLTIRQTLPDPSAAAEIATRWHLCVSVLDLRVAGMDVPRTVGVDPEEPAFVELQEQFRQALGAAGS